ncbi:MAG: gliding motility lipoprotein GldH [Flavobacteriales bacterium]
MAKAGKCICFSLLISGFFSCGKALESAASKGFTKAWYKRDTVDFAFENKDTMQAKNLYLVVRNNDAYPFRNLYLFVALHAPSGRVVTDTLAYRMADARGNWLGSGIGAEKESVLAYRLNRVFGEIGSYHLTITQGMRRDSLHGITRVGYLLEISKK